MTSPSYSWRPSTFTAGKMPGIAALASSAGTSGPSLSTCGAVVATSMVTAPKGNASSAKVRSAWKYPVMTLEPGVGKQVRPSLPQGPRLGQRAAWKHHLPGDLRPDAAQPDGRTLRIEPDHRAVERTY